LELLIGFLFWFERRLQLTVVKFASVQALEEWMLLNFFMAVRTDSFVRLEDVNKKAEILTLTTSSF
jgi:hypothetical protein